MVNYLNNPVFYFFAKTNEIYFKKFEAINNYIKNNKINSNEIYYDIYERNNLDFKNKLNKILLSVTNSDICILSVEDLGRDTKDFMNIVRICYARKNRLFNIKTNSFFDIDRWNLLIEKERIKRIAESK